MPLPLTSPSSTCHPDGISIDTMAGDFWFFSLRFPKATNLWIISSKGGLGLPRELTGEFYQNCYQTKQKLEQRHTSPTYLIFSYCEIIDLVQSRNQKMHYSKIWARDHNKELFVIHGTTLKIIHKTPIYFKFWLHKMLKKVSIPWNENPNTASTTMSKLVDKSTGRSSTGRKGMDNDSNYKNSSLSFITRSPV